MSGDSPIESTKPSKDAEICRACGFTLYNHIGNTGVRYPCWTPSGRYSRDKHTNEPRESTKELHESKERKPETLALARLQEAAEQFVKFGHEYGQTDPTEDAKLVRVGLSRGAEPETPTDTTKPLPVSLAKKLTVVLANDGGIKQAEADIAAIADEKTSTIFRNTTSEEYFCSLLREREARTRVESLFGRIKEGQQHTWHTQGEGV